MNNEYTLDDIIAGLSQPTPREAIEALTKKTKGGEFTLYYVGREYIQERLNACAGGRWSVSFDILTQLPSLWVVQCTITIDGVSRCDVGMATDLESETPKSAFTDALKRAATMWGIGLDLYRGDHALAGDSKPQKQAKKATPADDTEWYTREKDWNGFVDWARNKKGLANDVTVGLFTPGMTKKQAMLAVEEFILNQETVDEIRADKAQQGVDEL